MLDFVCLLCVFEFMIENSIKTTFMAHAIYVWYNSCLNCLFYEKYGKKIFLVTYRYIYQVFSLFHF